jgi:hypothetical protein
MSNQSSAFNALIEAAKRDDIQGVVVPALSHLTCFPGLQLAMKDLVERETGTRVLVMYPSPEGPT